MTFLNLWEPLWYRVLRYTFNSYHWKGWTNRRMVYVVKQYQRLTYHVIVIKPKNNTVVEDSPYQYDSLLKLTKTGVLKYFQFPKLVHSLIIYKNQKDFTFSILFSTLLGCNLRICLGLLGNQSRFEFWNTNELMFWKTIQVVNCA